MRNKTIAMASALLIGGLLTLNGTVFADVADTTTATSVNQRPAQAGKMLFGKSGNLNRQAFGGMHQKGWNIQLDALVTAGTITQTTADKIQAYLDTEHVTMKAEMEKVTAMTSDERKAYFESNKSTAPKKLDLLSTLIEKGVITQTEADAIEAVQETKQAEQRAKQLEYTTSALNNLVKDNVITAEQVVKITEHMSKQQAARTAEMEKIKAMTQEERTAYFESNTDNRGNMLAQLVTDNVLTQAQADAIEKVLHPRGFQKDFGRGNFRK